MKNKLHTIAYLRVSTADQDLEKNKDDILYFTVDGYVLGLDTPTLFKSQ
jgi:hypothetical protein